MYFTTSLIAAALLLHPLAVFSQVTPQQTIVPFSTLPACAAQCGPLFDAQGACSPPVVPTSSTSCFCAYSKLQPFYTAANVVCPGACPQDPTGLTKIQAWFLGLCGKGGAQPTQTGSSPTTGGTGTSTAAPGTGGGSGGTPSSGHTKASWISNHWQWIIMIVVILVAIIIGWIAACLLRRRYIRRKEREFELRPPAAPWVAGGAAHPGANGAPGPSPYASSGVLSKGKNRESDVYTSRPPSAALGAISEKSEGERKKKKWVVKERT